MRSDVKTYPIMKVLVGSKAHGLDGPNSDNDYRGVFVVPTREILALGRKVHNTSWIEGNDDDTSWEIGHFLTLAVKCNPTILEAFLAPVVEGIGWSMRLRGLFPYVWSSIGVKEAFVGYGLNQRKKFLDSLGEKQMRPKFAVAYLRTLYQAWELLSTGTFTIRTADTPVGSTLVRWKNQGVSGPGEVIDFCHLWTERVEEAFQKNPDKKADLEKVNDFLIRIRKDFWD